MNRETLGKYLHRFRSRLAMTAFVCAAVVGTSFLATGWADALYIVTGVEDTAIVLDKSAKAPDFSSQMFYLGSRSSGYEMSFRSGHSVTVHHGDRVISTLSKRESLSRLLERLDAEPGPLDTVAVDVGTDSVTVTVDSEVVYYDRIVEEVPYETVRRPNPDMKKGTEKVVQTGVNGLRTAIYEVVWNAGKESSRQFVEEVDTSVVDEIIEYGTGTGDVNSSDRITNVAKNADGSGTLTFASGATLNFSSAKTMEATAYTAGYGGADYTTATGTFVHIGTVAVDKRVIPLGTKMYIVSTDGKVVYGTAVAEDTGVRGNRIDLYYDTYQQCINFGRRNCTVYFLE